MATIKPTFTITKINDYLKKYRTITFESGTYKLDKSMILYSDTKITCAKGVIFERTGKGRMLQTYADPNTKGYDGVHNVSWSGGEFHAGTNATAANVIVCFHSDEILLENLIIDNCINLHSIEINASRNVTIRGCTIKNQTDLKNDGFREAIQIDFANYDGLTISKATAASACYDGTHCKNILIENCTIENCPNGIGTHTVGPNEVYHEDITIKNCKFTKIKKNCIKVLGMKNVTIDNCDGNVYLNSMDVAHKLSGGKTNLLKTRHNINVVVKNKNSDIKLV